MDDNVKDKSIFLKLKDKFTSMTNSGKIKLIIIILVFCVIGVLYINYTSGSDLVSNTVQESSLVGYYVSSINYSQVMEEKLENVLENIEGVENVEVMITLDSSLELVLADTSEEKINSSSASSTSNSYTVQVSSPLILDTEDGEKPLVIKEILPKIKGVLVVCKGASNVSTKLDIIQAVKSLLDVNSSNIQVLSGK